MGRTQLGLAHIVLMAKEMGVPDEIAQIIQDLVAMHANKANITTDYNPFKPEAAQEVSLNYAEIRFWYAEKVPLAIAKIADQFHRLSLKRADVLGELASDLAWHMLLALAVYEGRGMQMSVSSLCLCSGGAPTTSLRHVVAMERHGLIRRERDAKDGRRIWVHMTDETRVKVCEMILGFCARRPEPPTTRP